MSVHARPSGHVEDPAQVAVIVADAAVIPVIGEALVVCIIAVVDEMIGKDEIPAGGEGQADSVTVFHRRIVPEGIIAAVIGEMKPFLVIRDVIAHQKVVVAIIVEADAVGVARCRISIQEILPGAVKVDSGRLVAVNIVFSQKIVVAIVFQRYAVPVVVTDIISYNGIIAAGAKGDGTVTVLREIVVPDSIPHGVRQKDPAVTLFVDVVVPDAVVINCILARMDEVDPVRVVVDIVLNYRISAGMIQADSIQAAADSVVADDVAAGEDMNSCSARGSDIETGYHNPIDAKGYGAANCPGVQKRPSFARQDDRFCDVQALAVRSALNLYLIACACGIHRRLNALARSDAYRVRPGNSREDEGCRNQHR